ncbi:hypothetical protein VE04_07499 [Pseudogymnoascus sp. 24MN13]|nr:hypothetical protein VE04_07499 [Pseudogymnoascus sp. 24MN13]
MTKLICIIGVTGNQGGSVARRFLLDPTDRVRGITRDPTSPAAQSLSSLGVEIVAADLDDVDTLIPAFAGAHLIFSVTNYWEPFFRPDCRSKAAELGIGCRRYAYEVEVRQGRNIADAAARTVEARGEDGFIASTLSHAGQSDGTFQMSFPTAPNASVPHLAVNADMGNFVYAVSQMPPGKSYMAAGTECSWSEFIRLWSKETGVPAAYKEFTLEQFIEMVPDKEFGAEAGDMFAYSSDPGYDGGDKTLLRAEDIRKAGIDCPMTSLEEYMKEEDWSAILGQ